MSDKELWFIRHTETVTPDSYDFDLSRQGKRNARILGWYLAAQNVAKPLVVLRFNELRGATMASCLTSYVQKDPSANIIKAVIQDMPLGQIESYRNLLNIVLRLDAFKDHCNGQTPSTVAFVMHRMYEAGFDLLSFILAASPRISTEAFDQNSRAITSSFTKHSRHMFENGELIRMRFAVSNWQDIRPGSGQIVERTKVQTLRPRYKAWRQSQRYQHQS